MIDYLKEIGMALSQVLNTLFKGSCKVTTSARLGKKVIKKKKWAIIVDKIISTLFFDPNHCVDAYYKDRDRAQGSHEKTN